MAPDEIEWHKLDRADDSGARAEERTELELALGRSAFRTAAVGPRLHNRFTGDLAPYKVAPPLRVDPGFDDGPSRPEPLVPPGLWRILLFGRLEDAHLKGLDIAAGAVGLMVGRRDELAEEIEFVVRGAPAGMSDQLRARIRSWSGLASLSVVPRPYTASAERLSADLWRASLVLMPSRQEGFGLVGVEAITAGTPVLVSAASGLGALLRQALPAEHARRVVVDMTGDDEQIRQRWARAIEAVLRDREAAFHRAAEIRTLLAMSIRWSAAATTLLDAVTRPGEPSLEPAEHSSRPTGPRPEPGPWAPTEPVPQPVRNVLSVDDRKRLVLALIELPILQSAETRGLVVNELPTRIAASIPRYPTVHADVLSIVKTCLDYPDGLDDLMGALRYFAGGSATLGNVERLLAEWAS